MKMFDKPAAMVANTPPKSMFFLETHASEHAKSPAAKFCKAKLCLTV